MSARLKWRRKDPFGKGVEIDSQMPRLFPVSLGTCRTVSSRRSRLRWSFMVFCHLPPPPRLYALHPELLCNRSSGAHLTRVAQDSSLDRMGAKIKSGNTVTADTLVSRPHKTGERRHSFPIRLPAGNPPARRLPQIDLATHRDFHIPGGSLHDTLHLRKRIRARHCGRTTLSQVSIDLCPVIDAKRKEFGHCSCSTSQPRILQTDLNCANEWDLSFVRMVLLLTESTSAFWATKIPSAPATRLALTLTTSDGGNAGTARIASLPSAFVFAPPLWKTRPARRKMTLLLAGLLLHFRGRFCPISSRTNRLDCDVSPPTISRSTALSASSRGAHGAIALTMHHSGTQLR